MFMAQLPVQGDLVSVELPDSRTGLYAEAIVSRALAYQRVGKKITSTRSWARSIAATAARAESSGGAIALRERQTQLEHLSRYRRQTSSCYGYPLEIVLDMLATGSSESIDLRRAMGPERLMIARTALAALIGHPLDHPENCERCAAVAARDWASVLFEADVPDSAVRDLYAGLVEARVIPAAELRAARGVDDF